MHSKKNDSFSPKRATNIDGFFAKAGNDRPRHPIFRDNPAKPQHPVGTLMDMPRRTTPQSVLTTSRPESQDAAIAAVLDTPLDSGVEGGESRRRVSRSEPPRKVGREPKSDKADKPEHPHHPGRLKKILKRSALLLGVVVLIGGLWFGFKFYRNIAKITGNSNPLSLLKAFTPAHLKNQNGRVNILVAGNSADDVGHNGADLTDSIMVLSVNTRDNTALMLSIPRDLWVYIPGVGHSKINAAYPNGGMDQLQSVVEDNLGIAIDYQALVNYSAFKDLVNAVNGITITIKSSDPRGIYDPNIDYTSRNCCALAKYPNGAVTLNGTQALNLARARGDPSIYGIPYGFDDGDFDRTQHQRDMLIAIKGKVSQSSIIANPFKVTSLVDAVGNNVKTNLQLNEIETLYSYMKKIDDSKIDSYNINNLAGGNTTLLANYTSDSGQSALIPAAGIDDFSAIQAQLLKLLSDDPVVKEAANVVVLNGTDTAGLARVQSSKLTSKGITVLAQANAPATQATSTIIDNSAGKKSATLSYLKKMYSATVVTNPALTAGYPSADIIVILGQSVVSSQN